jgi:hypothetical protein
MKNIRLDAATLGNDCSLSSITTCVKNMLISCIALLGLWCRKSSFGLYPGRTRLARERLLIWVLWVLSSI